MILGGFINNNKKVSYIIYLLVYSYKLFDIVTVLTSILAEPSVNLSGTKNITSNIYLKIFPSQHTSLLQPSFPSPISSPVLTDQWKLFKNIVFQFNSEDCCKDATFHGLTLISVEFTLFISHSCFIQISVHSRFYPD